MKRWLILAILAMALALVSCAPDPRLQAEADKTLMQAKQDAADQAQRRAQSDAWFQLRYVEQQAMSDQWVASWNSFVRTSMQVLNLATVVVLLALAIGTAIALIGVGRGVYQGAWVRANLIGQNAETGQFPVLLHRVNNFQYMLIDVNRGMVLQLDIRQSGDRQMIATSGAVALAGVVSRQARLAGEHAEGVALVGTNPVVVMGGSDGQ